MKHLAMLVFTFALYLALAGALGKEQLISAAVMALVAIGIAAAIRRVAGRPIAFSAAHLRPWGRAMLRLPGDTLRIGMVLLRTAAVGGSPGLGATPHFRFGPVDDAAERGRRVTAVLAGSMTPDTVVLHVQPGEGRAVCHRLLATPQPDRPEWLA
jgi:hypothetical protein